MPACKNSNKTASGFGARRGVTRIQYYNILQHITRRGPPCVEDLQGHRASIRSAPLILESLVTSRDIWFIFISTPRSLQTKSAALGTRSLTAEVPASLQTKIKSPRQMTKGMIQHASVHLALSSLTITLHISCVLEMDHDGSGLSAPDFNPFSTLETGQIYPNFL